MLNFFHAGDYASVTAASSASPVALDFVFTCIVSSGMDTSYYLLGFEETPGLVLWSSLHESLAGLEGHAMSQLTVIAALARMCTREVEGAGVTDGQLLQRMNDGQSLLPNPFTRLFGCLRKAIAVRL